MSVRQSRVRMVRHESDMGSWETVRAEPHPELRPNVRGYCGYAEKTAAPMRRRELPGASVELIISFGDPLRLIDARDPAGRGEERTSFVAGLSDSYAITGTDGTQRGVQVTLSPLGAYMFFGLPAQELSNRAVRLEDVLGREANRLAARLREAPTWGARFELLDKIIEARLSEAHQPSPGVAWAWERMNEGHGTVRVEALAGHLGWSRRHLAVRFRQQVGLPPKLLARIFRFRRAARLIERRGGEGLAEIAFECGYYDQSHLNRDFREFAGSSPTEFLVRRLPDEGGIAG